MRVVLQRVSGARVRIGGQTVSEVGRGLVALVAFAADDTAATLEWMAQKLWTLRVFPDESDRMNRSLADIGGELLVVSQFTLYGDARRGRRPSFAGAADPDTARRLYDTFVDTCRRHGPVSEGEFGAMMEVELVNDGPVTLQLERQGGAVRNAHGQPAATSRPLRIGVIGSSSATETEMALARAVGAAIARAEAVTVCGGLGGVMRAAADGAAAEGGIVIGILPGGTDEDAAPGVTIPIATGMGEGRNVLVARASEAVIAIAGEWGTLSEAAFCRKFGTPLIGLRCTLPERVVDEGASDPIEAVARAVELAQARRNALA